MKIVRATNFTPILYLSIISYPIFLFSKSMLFSLHFFAFLLFFFAFLISIETLLDFLSFACLLMTYFSRFVSSIRFNLWNWRIIECCIASFTFFFSLIFPQQHVSGIAGFTEISFSDTSFHLQYGRVAASALHLCEIYYYGNEPHPLGSFYEIVLLELSEFFN